MGPACAKTLTGDHTESEQQGRSPEGEETVQSQDRQWMFAEA